MSTTQNSDDQAAVLRHAAVILEQRARKQPAPFMLRAVCRMLRRQAAVIAREASGG